MTKISLNANWQFHLGDPQGPFWQPPDYSTWSTVDLPHDWSIGLERTAHQPSSMAGGYFPMGRGHYRKALEVPESWRGKKVFIDFEGVYMNAEVRLNEHFLGRHPYGYTSFSYELTPYLKLGQTNYLAVVVDNATQLNSRWYSGSGIYRPVWLRVVEPVYLALWGVYVTTPFVTPDQAIVRVRTTIENQSEQAQEITLASRFLSPSGAQVSLAETTQAVKADKVAKFEQEIAIVRPQLWSPDAPHLYQVETVVLANGAKVDATTTTFGIRSLSVDAENGFVLNGQPMKLKGGCVHHDNGILGAASYPRSEERKVEVLKASGYNAIRCAHNPPAPAFLEACDRLGMLVIDEAFDCWRDGKNPYDYHVAFDDWWQRDIYSMVVRDRNHPSVVFWSIGNELVERARPGGAMIARQLAEAVRALDPTRPITAAMNGDWNNPSAWELMDPTFASLGVGGYNYAWRSYVSDHARLPKRVMMGTESFPLEALENWQCVEDNPYVIGDFVWTSLDYLGESGIGRVFYEEEPFSFLGLYPWHQANCGDLDLCGLKRPQSYYRDMVWGCGNPLYIAVHHPIPAGKTPHVSLWGWPEVSANWNWPGREGQTFQVEVYSTCEEVELFLNGQSVGKKPTTRAEKLTATFDVPYQPGVLKAVGYRAGQPAAEYQLETVGAPAGLRLTADQPEILADPLALSYVTVEIVDGTGRWHPGTERLVTFSLEGPGTILAVGSSNPTSTERYTGNQRTTYQGRCLVVVKSNGQPGVMTLHAESGGLEATDTTIVAG